MKIIDGPAPVGCKAKLVRVDSLIPGTIFRHPTLPGERICGRMLNGGEIEITVLEDGRQHQWRCDSEVIPLPDAVLYTGKTSTQ